MNNNIKVKTDSYRSIFKATTIFGGVQLVNIIITVIRAKIVAILLGSEGMGLNGLFINTTRLIQDLTGLGLKQSAVKNIAQAKASGNNEEVSKIVSVFRKLVLFTALLGLAVAVLLGSKLSQWVFGSDEYAWSFRILGITFVFAAITAGTYTVLQGLRMVRYLAAANILGALFSLLVATPFYYFFGMQGVVPALVGASIVSLLISRYYRNKIKVIKYTITLKEAFFQGAGMIKLGLVLASTAFLTSAVKFLISAFITRTGTLSDLGMYNAGISITMGYTALIFAAMTKDYFPRLTEAVHKSGNLWRRIINEQTNLISILLTPILLFIITTLPWMIRLLLSDKFLEITDFVSFIVLGIFIQGPTWTIGVMIVAKADLKLKMFTEIGSNLLFLFLSIGFYYYYGLIGIGVGFFLTKTFNFLMILAIVKFRYFFSFNRRERIIIVFSFIACSSLSAIQLLKGYPLTHYIGGFLFVLSTLFSLKELNQRMDLKSTLLDGVKKLKKN